MKDWSTRISENFVNWIIQLGPRLGLAAMVLIIGLWVIRVLRKLFHASMDRRSMHSNFRPYLENLFKIVLYGLLVLALMQILGIRMTIFTALVAALGVAAGLALSGTLQNFTSGILIILFKPFIIGDSIKTQGEEGIVKMIRLFYTVIITPANVTLIVPNSKLSNEVIFNLTKQNYRRLDTVLKFGFDVDWQQVREKLYKAAGNCEGCRKDPEVSVALDKLESDGYTVVISAWLNAEDFYEVKKAFLDSVYLTLAELKKSA